MSRVSRAAIFAVWALLCLYPSPAITQTLADEVARLGEMLGDNASSDALSLALDLKERTAADGGRSHVQVLSLLAAFYVEHGNAELGLQTVREALDSAGVSDPILEGQLLLVEAQALQKLGRFPAVERAARQLIRFAEDNADNELLANGHYLLAASQARQNRSGESEGNYLTAAAIFDRIGNRRGSMRVRNDLANQYKLLGDYSRALTMFEALYPQAAQEGVDVVAVYALLEMGDVHRLLGDYDAAETWLLKADVMATQAGNARWRMYVHEYLAELYRAAGRIEEAMRQTNAFAQQKAIAEAQLAATRISELEMTRLAADHEFRLALLEKEQELDAISAIKNRTFVIAVLLGLVLLLIIAFSLYRLWRKQTRLNSALRASNALLDQVASTDALTGLGNRHGLSERLSMLKRKGLDYTLILLDIDRFKSINDEFGHDHGDIVLAEFARRINSRLRQTDYAVRWGGEEFLLILCETTRSEAYDVALQLQDILRRSPIIAGDAQHHVTATFGLAALTDHGDFDAALKAADKALSLGKQGGRDRIVTLEDSVEKKRSMRIVR